jgi:hypothetical protein
MPRAKKPLPEIPDTGEDSILIGGKFYKGNENLLSKNAKIGYTEEMLEEWRLCKKSILSFAERHFTIITEDGKEVIQLRKFQKTLLKNFKDFKRNIVLSSRQSGKSTIVTVYALWKVCFFEHQRIAIVANKGETAQQIFERIRMSFEDLPIYLKPSVKSWRKDGFELSNGSNIIISSASTSAIRGRSINILIIDECAHIPNDLMKELWKSVIPTISANRNGEIITISTPNGADKDNKFYEIYMDSKKEGSVWKLESVFWWDIPGRDEAWKINEIATMGSLHDFQQEYENVFHPPGKSVIDPELLEKLKAQCHDPILVTDDGAYKIYTMPKPTSFYVVGVDVGEGIGRTNTTAQILDVSDLRNIEQVAVYANNKISPYLFGTRLMGIMNDWGRPPVLIENNNYGQQVLDVLHNTHNYESIVSYRFEGMSKHYDNENRLGIHSHTNTRYKGLTNFRYWVDAIKAVKFHDLDTLIEIAEFVQLPNYTFSKKREEDRDDRVFGLVWGLFVLEPTLAKTYFNITETDDQGRPFNLVPFTDNSDLIKKSPIFTGTVHVYKKEEGTRVPLMFIPQGKEKDPTMDDEAKMLGNWLHRWEPKGVLSGYKQYNPEVIWKSDAVKEKKEIEDDSYRPIVLF